MVDISTDRPTAQKIITSSNFKADLVLGSLVASNINQAGLAETRFSPGFLSDGETFPSTRSPPSHRLFATSNCLCLALSSLSRLVTN